MISQQTLLAKSQILEVVSEKPCSVGRSIVILEDRVQPQAEEIGKWSLE